jgi:hypothetical protein
MTSFRPEDSGAGYSVLHLRHKQGAGTYLLLITGCHPTLSKLNQFLDNMTQSYAWAGYLRTIEEIPEETKDKSQKNWSIIIGSIYADRKGTYVL